MPIQRSRFHSAIQSPPGQQLRVEVVEPILGLNQARPATNLRPGETPFTQNFVAEDRYLTPRSGLSQYGTSGSTYQPIGVFDAERVDRTKFAYSVFATSSGTTGFFDSATIYNPLPDVSVVTNNELVITNWIEGPKWLSVGFDVSTLSHLTTFYSIDSRAYYCEALDDRLVFFHTGTASASQVTGIHAKRVAWSGRGTPHNFTTPSGGYEDLVSMQGSGTGIIAERDRGILLSEEEVWVARPRRDDNAFDFFNLDKSKGCPQLFDKTPQNTEIGTVWLGNGYQFQRVIANEVRSLGDKVRDFLKQEVREPALSWGLYSPVDHSYLYFYSDTTGEFPSKALLLRTDTVQPVGGTRDDGSWFMLDFGSGYQFPAGTVFEGNILLLSSKATPYRLLSAQTTDSGTAIDCRWRSHMLRQKDIFPYEAMQEFWFEFENSGQSASLNLHVSTDNGATFGSASNVSLPPTTGEAFLPVAPTASRNPMYEIRLADGSKPKIARIQTTLRGYSGRFSG